IRQRPDADAQVQGRREEDRGAGRLSDRQLSAGRQKRAEARRRNLHCGRAKAAGRHAGHAARECRQGDCAADVSCATLLTMRLTDEEQDILAGKQGAIRQQALQHQIKVGEFFGAADFVPVTQAHIMADTESLGEAGVRWLEALATSPDERHVCVPTITDPRGTDFSKASMLGQSAAMLDLERRAIAAFETLGVTMTDTCINYQTIQAPTRNEHVAFGDTGVVIYSNSVCGARSNFE